MWSFLLIFVIYIKDYYIIIFYTNKIVAKSVLRVSKAQISRIERVSNVFELANKGIYIKISAVKLPS